MGKNKLILTSFGLTTKTGRTLIGNALKGSDLENKKIFLFHEPYISTGTMLIEECLRLGFKKENVILSGEQRNDQEVLECDIYYITEGNTYDVLTCLKENKLDNLMKEGFRQGNKVYIGCSAGASIAGATLEGVSVEERKIFECHGMSVDDVGLGLLDGIVIPHCTESALEYFIKKNPGVKEKHRKILSVSDEECLVLEV